MARSVPFFCFDAEGILAMVMGAMMHSASWRALSFASFLVCCSATAQAEQFSADLISTRDGAAISIGKLRTSTDRVRLETPEFPDGFFVSDGSKRVSYFARPNARIFMDARQSNWLVQFFVPVDPDDPCRQWRSMADVAGAEDRNAQWRCEQVGSEMIAGRAVTRYRIILSAGREMLGWIDPELKFPLKIQREDGTTAIVENVLQGPQPDQLFEVPAGFRKFDPEALIKRIKQSDVWVEPPAR
jgi:hypothetical protein